ncbi:MAG TPA: glycosyltransferase [Acidobacteriaceae bacterium]|nr:glycosyltransferase [Acidobacteriaceae bacterium]
MKICLVAAFPPSRRQLSEYSYHIARELRRYPDVELTILADELTDYKFSTDGCGVAVDAQQLEELPGFDVIRCWKFGSLGTPVRLLRTIRELKPDVVWFNLVFSSFGTPQSPVSAFAGLSIPSLTRASGFFTHITLHHIIEHINFGDSGVRKERLFRMGTDLATRVMLKADSVSVLLSSYRRTLMQKYSARNIMLGTHGTFTAIPTPPDFSRHNDDAPQILAFGHWGTYKRLETLLQAFPALLKEIPNARLVVAGGNHPTRPGYWESVRDAQPAGLPVEFRGYVPQEKVAALFRESSVLIMPYHSSTGSSGPAHQACEHGIPIVCSDIPDFHCMAQDDDMAISFYKTDDSAHLAKSLATLLKSPELRRKMAEHNYAAGVRMSMANVARSYLRWFELHQCKSLLENGTTLSEKASRTQSRWGQTLGDRILELMPNNASVANANLSAVKKTVSSVPLPVSRHSLSAQPRAVNEPVEEEGLADVG